MLNFIRRCWFEYKSSDSRRFSFYNNVCDCKENQKIFNNSYTSINFDKFTRKQGEKKLNISYNDSVVRWLGTILG